MTLALRPSFNRESFEILLTREGSGPSSIEQEQGVVDLGAGSIKTRVLKYKTPGSRISVQRYRLPADDVRRSTDARELTFGNGKKKFSISQAGLAAVIRALDTCVADLRKHWNADAAPAAKATSAQGDIRGLFTPNDYPAIALTEQLEGQATFTLLVDEKGKVAGCDLVKPSGVPALDVMGCEVLRKRAQFNPARDATGQPVRSTVVSPPVRWRVE